MMEIPNYSIRAPALRHREVCRHIRRGSPVQQPRWRAVVLHVGPPVEWRIPIIDSMHGDESVSLPAEKGDGIAFCRMNVWNGQAFQQPCERRFQVVPAHIGLPSE